MGCCQTAERGQKSGRFEIHQNMGRPEVRRLQPGVKNVCELFSAGRVISFGKQNIMPARWKQIRGWSLGSWIANPSIIGDEKIIINSGTSRETCASVVEQRRAKKT
ncbi:hypothetical protein D0X99_16940 [Algoriphagus lacus]|uniref:Uncharacterized protein n=1 Tax=Algoriphagus lacus TaxID=2056311 RepID=A0A418PN57_9BACT|nr:hypothetical protein D0X99_16940 [Algoriphagus lacus]